ncbi:amino acid ABC transporter substrate-binding protein [Basilea psittacipulmonis]|uniref:ABC transporter n=1 Tax=Basilea psittacipulmonis DSM 24701 TaxID=1072685 RepID=A0A077DII9_9BURK|nr:amino acid ABC transporter substrate-binding protein [Basilea psittacipulmonis]AIL33287.1 ABC transporter [Basilea psittacipulmonis DSM 24701]
MKLSRLALMAVVAGVAVGAQAGVRLDKIKNTGVLNMGHRDASIPFSYLDDNHQPIGYAMDICYGIVKSLEENLGKKIQVNLVPVTSATRIPLVQNGSVDLVCGSATNNPERQKQVAFAPTTYVAASRFVSVKDDHIHSLEDLKGQTVTSSAGTSSLKWLNQVNVDQKLEMRVIPAKDHAAGFLNVETGRAKAFFMDDVLLAGLVANSKDPARYVINDKANTVEPYGLIYPKDDVELKALIDDAVIAMMKDGTVEKLYNKWFMNPIPPKNINLNLPMSEELKKVLVNPTSSGDPKDYQ